MLRLGSLPRPLGGRWGGFLLRSNIREPNRRSRPPDASPRLCLTRRLNRPSAPLLGLSKNTGFAMLQFDGGTAFLR